ERGDCVFAVKLNEDAGKKKVASNPKQIAFLKGDISKESVAKEAVALAISKFGKLTSIVNNAHASRQKPLVELTEEDWELSMNTGLDRKSTRLNSSHVKISYAVFCLTKQKS